MLYAPLQLPHGAEILQFKASVYDNSASSDVGLYLYRMDTSAVASAAAEVGTSSFSGGQVVLSDTTINMGTEIVDNEHYAYFVLATGVMEPTILEVFVTSVMVRYRLGASTG
ncbi:MAG: hypothetical protein A2135_08810 [Actinobacteria bacterium RBG_16_67_15]|nr:MAG: hypothetical protein A2135_08810 [Actinobacteria bacterium RBG_16_67_15]